jgi:hypothetical protein
MHGQMCLVCTAGKPSAKPHKSQVVKMTSMTRDDETCKHPRPVRESSWKLRKCDPQRADWRNSNDIWKVPRSNLDLKIDWTDSSLSCCCSFPPSNVEMESRLGQDRFLPNHFQFINQTIRRCTGRNTDSAEKENQVAKYLQRVTILVQSFCYFPYTSNSWPFVRKHRRRENMKCFSSRSTTHNVDFHRTQATKLQSSMFMLFLHWYRQQCLDNKAQTRRDIYHKHTVCSSPHEACHFCLILTEIGMY